MTACCLSRIDGMLTHEDEYEVLAAIRLARKEVENMPNRERTMNLTASVNAAIKVGTAL